MKYENIFVLLAVYFIRLASPSNNMADSIAKEAHKMFDGYFYKRFSDNLFRWIRFASVSFNLDSVFPY